VNGPKWRIHAPYIAREALRRIWSAGHSASRPSRA